MRFVGAQHLTVLIDLITWHSLTRPGPAGTLQSVMSLLFRIQLSADNLLCHRSAATVMELHSGTTHQRPGAWREWTHNVHGEQIFTNLHADTNCPQQYVNFLCIISSRPRPRSLGQHLEKKMQCFFVVYNKLTPKNVHSPKVHFKMDSVSIVEK